MNIKQTEWGRADIDRLCDLVAEDCYSFGQIADMMGRTRNQVTSRWTRLANDMEAKLSRRNRANGF